MKSFAKENPMIAMYVIWGDREDLYAEAAFSICTMLADPAIAKVAVLASNPALFAFLGDKVDVVPATPGEVAEWGGPRDFLFRRKIRGLQTISARYPGKDVLYLDTDTFRGASMRPVADAVGSGRLCMGDGTGYLAKARDSGNRKTYRMLRGKTVRGFTIDETAERFNAGILGIPGGMVGEILDDALAMSDEIYDITDYIGSEEIAYSFTFQKRGPVQDIGNTVGHYYGNKAGWQSLIRRFFLLQFLQGADLETIVAESVKVDMTAAPTYEHRPRRRRQLLALADRFWPTTRRRHFPEQPARWL